MLHAGEIKLAADDLAGATANHHAALVGVRSDINTRVAATLVAASVVIAVTVVWIRNPRAATVEGPALDSAATSTARVIGTFFTTLSGIKFSATALATTVLGRGYRPARRVGPELFMHLAHLCPARNLRPGS